MRELLLVAKREYVRAVRKPTFWLVTLGFPVFIIALSLLSGASAQRAEEIVKQKTDAAQTIYIADDSKLIDPQLVQPPLQFTNDFAAAQAAVKAGNADAVIHFPADLATNFKADIALQSKGILLDGGYEDVAKNLVKNSLLNKIGNKQLVSLFNASISFSRVSYKNGQEVSVGIESFIVPAIAVGIYFTLITFASSYLLMSVSEEKENRMIETILSIVTPKQLVWGKILGQLSVIVTQVGLLTVFGIGGLLVLNRGINLDLSQVTLTPGMLLLTIFYLVCGFLINANLMVGVGSAVPTYREAQSTSSIFIFMSVAPIYLAGIILAEPSGTIAQILSYFPFTSAMILMFRNTLGELTALEVVVSVVVLLIYVGISFILSFRMFELGALEYSSKVGVRRLFKQFQR